jgi:hypothetical protein
VSCAACEAGRGVPAVYDDSGHGAELLEMRELVDAPEIAGHPRIVGTLAKA